jgi:hypothetical protein
MSHANGMTLRAVIHPDGGIYRFELSEYGGGGTMTLRVQRVGSTLFWVLEGTGYKRTMLFRLADGGTWDSTDMDELGLEALALLRKGGLAERDAFWREHIESETGQALPIILPGPYKNSLWASD